METKYLFRNLLKPSLCVITLFFLSCSKSDDDNTLQNVIEPVDIEAINGKYSGTWFWTPGDSPITMEVIRIGASNDSIFNVKFYESANFVPGFNIDGVTPDAIGTIEINNNEAYIDLNLATDTPPCIGNYTGPGTRDEEGRFIFNMSIIHDCGADGTAIFNLLKTAN